MASTSTACAAPPSPLDLPEIRAHIAHYLTGNKHDLCSCILVSRTWRTDFLPQLWHTMHFDTSLSYYLSKHNFQQHEHLVRELVIHDPDFLLGGWPGPSCRHINRLEYRPYVAQRQWIAPNYVSTGEQTATSSDDSGHQGSYEDDLQGSLGDDEDDNGTTNNSTSTSTSISIRRFLQLVRQQTCLRHLNEDWSLHSKEHTLRFAQGFMRSLHPNLISLHITKWKVSVPEMNMMIKNCPRLEQLFLRSVEIVPVNADFNTAAFPDHQDDEDGKEEDDEVDMQSYDEEEKGQMDNLGQAIITTTAADSTSVLDFRQIKEIHIDQIVLHTSRLSFRGYGLESIGFEAYTFFTRYAIFNSPRPFTWSFPNTRSLKYIGKGRDIHDTEVGNAIQDILTSCSPDSIPLCPRPRSQQHYHQHQQHQQYQHQLQQRRKSLSPDEVLLKSRQLKEVTISNCSIRRSLVSAIVDTFGEGLEVLDLVGCGGLSRLNLHQILVRCGNLRVFRGPESFLWTRDMVFSEQTWSSKHLKELVVLIGIGMSLNKDEATDLTKMADTSSVEVVLAQESTRRSIDVVLDQLAQLRHLEVLDLSGDLDYHLAEDCRKGIPLVLSAGLDKLRGLSKLRKVYISGWEDEMSAREAEWMNLHWPHLEYIHSREGEAKAQMLNFATWPMCVRSSSTIVKQAGFATNPIQMQQQQQQEQQALDDRWGTGFPDDARVPRLGESDHEDSSTTDMSGPVFLPPPPPLQAQQGIMESSIYANPSSVLSYDGQRHRQGYQMQVPPTRPTTTMEPGFHTPPLPPLPTSIMTQAQAQEPSEVVIEMPPRLVANLRTRKVNRSSRLNDKYARMKSDMELIAQTPRSYNRIMRHQYDLPIRIGAPPLASTTPQSYGHLLPTIATAAASGVQPVQVPTYSTSDAQVQQQVYGQHAQFGSGNNTYEHGEGTAVSRPRDTESISSSSSVQYPCKRARIDENPVFDRTSISGGGGGGAFSTPHFRISTPVRTVGTPSPSSRVPFPTQGNQAEMEKEVEDEAGFDDWDLGEFLLDPEPLPVPSPPGMGPSGTQGYYNSSDHFATPTPTTHSHNAPVQVSGQDEPLPLDLDPVFSPTTFPSPGKAAVLDETPLTLRDRIHKLGSQMRASAAATVPRFEQAPFAPERVRERVGEEYAQTTRERSQDQQHYQLLLQHQQQQQQRARHSSRTELSFRLFSESRSIIPSNVTGIATRSEDFSTSANARSMANDPAPVPPRAVATATQNLQASSQRHSVGCKEYHCLKDNKEGDGFLAPDMSVLDGIEREIQDLADF
ncbi:hypothetical protein BGW39_006926 [Mortierella sp. 14UC]|nr:hypothetical protein BGW39_006926 [Mortierella sp. 14UC]